MQRHLILLLSMTTCVGMASGPVLRTGDDGSHPPCGEYGFPLDFLRQYYSPPQNPGESNYFIDLWAEQNLSTFARECNVTDNHALFINSHGGRATARGKRYSYYPHQSLLRLGEKTPQYSAADLAAVLGATNAAQIHNILVSGCNADGSFSPAELRKHFVNATNVVHMPAGELGYQPMFRQILTTRSSKIQPAYEMRVKNGSGKTEFVMGRKPSSHSTRLGRYVAELFRPGETAPFRVQTAGREILAPTHPSLLE